jgi:hypothetical protein
MDREKGPDGFGGSEIFGFYDSVWREERANSAQNDGFSVGWNG